MRRLQEEYHSKGKELYMCFVNLVKAFDSVLMKVLEWAMRKIEMPEVLVISVMSLYEGAKTRVTVDLSCQINLKLKWGFTKDLCCHLFFLYWWKMLSLNLPEVVISELLYADDLVLVSETIQGLSDKFLKWKEVLENKCLKVNLGKTKVMVTSGIIQDGLFWTKVDPCRVFSLRVKANSVLCGRWIYVPE